MNYVKSILFLSVICILSLSTSADIINGDFTTDLTGWDSSGVHYSTDPYYPESACFAPAYEEPLYPSSILSQWFETNGMNLLTFSFNAVILGEPETEHFYASLDATEFFHWSSDPEEEPELAEGVTMSPADEDGWIMISLMLPGGTESATLRFELIHDYNPMDAETTIYLDRVALGTASIVPVPGAVLLAGLGSYLAFSFRRKTR